MTAIGHKSVIFSQAFLSSKFPNSQLHCQFVVYNARISKGQHNATVKEKCSLDIPVSVKGFADFSISIIVQ